MVKFVVKCVVICVVKLKNCWIVTKIGVVVDMDPMIMIVVTKNQKDKKTNKTKRQKDKKTKAKRQKDIKLIRQKGKKTKRQKRQKY